MRDITKKEFLEWLDCEAQIYFAFETNMELAPSEAEYIEARMYMPKIWNSKEDYILDCFGLKFGFGYEVSDLDLDGYWTELEDGRFIMDYHDNWADLTIETYS